MLLRFILEFLVHCSVLCVIGIPVSKTGISTLGFDFKFMFE